MAFPFEESRKTIVRFRLNANETTVRELVTTEIISEMRSDALAAFAGLINDLVILDDLDVARRTPPPPNVWEVYPKMIVTGTTTEDHPEFNATWNALSDQWKEKMREKVQGFGGIVVSWHRHAYNQDLEEGP